MSETLTTEIATAGGGPGPEQTSAEQDHAYHFYRGNAIPWYVRMIWIGFWIFAIWYVIQHLFPALQTELISPP